MSVAGSIGMQSSYGSANTESDSQICRMESWELIREGAMPKHNQPCHGRPLTGGYERSTVAELTTKVHDCCDLWREKCLLQQVLCRYSVGRGGFHCGKGYRQHLVNSKSVVAVLVLNALFSTAIYGVTSEILEIIFGTEYVLSRLLVLHGITQILFPIAGHISDTRVGRHNVIRFSLWAAWIGFAVLGITVSLDGYNKEIGVTNRYFTLPLTFLLLSVSYVCFMSSIIPFGLDQLQGASHTHYSSFFKWWYWTLNIGVAFVNVPKYCSNKVELSILVQAEVGAVCTSLAIVLDALLQHWFVIEPASKQANPLAQIILVLRRAAKSKKNPLLIPSTVRHEVDMGNFSRMDSIKKRYGGEFETEQVEDVRTFFRVLLVLFSIGFAVFCYSTVFDTIGIMSTHMSGALPQLKTDTGLCHAYITLPDIVHAVFLLMLIPMVDLVLVPLLRCATVNPSILKWLSFGTVLAVLSVFSLFVFQAVNSHHDASNDSTCMFNEQAPSQLGMDVYWLLVPVFIATAAEIFINIPGFEFTCAQSPYNMRGLLVGMFFSVQGLFSLTSFLLQFVFSLEDVYLYPFYGKTGHTCSFWYCLIAVGISFLGLSLYGVVACKYKRRKRDDVFNEVNLIEKYFTSCVVNSI